MLRLQALPDNLEKVAERIQRSRKNIQLLAIASEKFDYERLVGLSLPTAKLLPLLLPSQSALADWRAGLQAIDSEEAIVGISHSASFDVALEAGKAIAQYDEVPSHSVWLGIRAKAPGTRWQQMAYWWLWGTPRPLAGVVAAPKSKVAEWLMQGKSSASAFATAAATDHIPIPIAHASVLPLRFSLADALRLKAEMIWESALGNALQGLRMQGLRSADHPLYELLLKFGLLLCAMAFFLLLPSWPAGFFHGEENQWREQFGPASLHAANPLKNALMAMWGIMAFSAALARAINWRTALLALLLVLDCPRLVALTRYDGGLSWGLWSYVLAMAYLLSFIRRLPRFSIENSAMLGIALLLALYSHPFNIWLWALMPFSMLASWLAKAYHEGIGTAVRAIPRYSLLASAICMPPLAGAFAMLCWGGHIRCGAWLDRVGALSGAGLQYVWQGQQRLPFGEVPWTYWADALLHIAPLPILAGFLLWGFVGRRALPIRRELLVLALFAAMPLSLALMGGFYNNNLLAPLFWAFPSLVALSAMGWNYAIAARQAWRRMAFSLLLLGLVGWTAARMHGLYPYWSEYENDLPRSANLARPPYQADAYNVAYTEAFNYLRKLPENERQLHATADLSALLLAGGLQGWEAKVLVPYRLHSATNWKYSLLPHRYAAKEGKILYTAGTADMPLVCVVENIRPELAQAVECHRLAGSRGVGQLDTAIFLVNQSLQKYGAHAESYYMLSLFLRDAGRLPEALDALGKSLAAAPDNRQAYFVRAEIFLELGQANEAIYTAQACLRIAPDEPGIHILAGDAYLHAGRFEEARRSFAFAKQLLAQCAGEYRGQLAARLEMGLGRLALEESGRMADDKALHLQQAIEHLEKALPMAEHDARIYEMLAKAYRGLGNIEKAEHYANLAVQFK